MPRPLRIALISLAAILVLVVAGAAIFIAQFDPNTFKPQIQAAVKRATGRDLTLRGPIGLAASLTPTIEAQDVAFANPPGYARPEMATLQSMRLRLALLPLLSRRIEIASLVLNRPDILLETNAAGVPNWQLAPQVAPSEPAGSQAPPTGAAGTKTAISLASVQINDGTLAYRDDRTGRTSTLGLGALTLTADSSDAPVHLTANATYGGIPFTLVADTGSLTRLQDPAATTPWLAKVTATTGNASLTIDGRLTKPLQGKGYSGAISGSVPDLATLQPLLPQVALPALRDLRFAAQAADKGGPIPDISALTLHVGESDLGARIPGLQIASADISAPALTQPTQIAVKGAFGGTPLAVSGHLGALGTLAPGAAPAPFDVDVSAQAVGGDITAKGTLANASALQGLDLALAGHIPDLAPLGSLVGKPLPSIKTIAFQGKLNDAAGGLRNGFALHGLQLTSNAGDLAGEIAATRTPRPAVTAALASNIIQADVIQAALDQMPKPPAPVANSSGSNSQGAKPPAALPPAARPPASPPQSDGRLFPDQPLPLDALRAADADLNLNFAKVHSGGADYRAIITHIILRNGLLTVEPLSADLPAGHLTGSAQLDAGKPTPLVHLALHAPGLALRTILQALHEPSYANGNLEMYADLRGAGNSPHTIAGSLTGPFSLAMAGGTIDNRLLGSMLGKVMDSLNALNLVGKGGTSELRCFAFRLDMQNGTGRIAPLALSSSLLTMTGSGTANLGNETVALQLLPQAKIGGNDLVIPVDVSGPIRNPRVNVNQVGATERNAGAVAGLLLKNNPQLGALGGLLGTDKGDSASKGDLCPAALAAARGQAAPAAPPPSAAPAALPGKLLPNPALNPAQTLRNLFR
jgi:AsmA protein